MTLLQFNQKIESIVGAQADKFTAVTEAAARRVIEGILQPGMVLSSGRCPNGGVDVWAEEIAQASGTYDPQFIYPPAVWNWAKGFKPRDIKIAAAGKRVHVIVLAQYPPGFQGRRFGLCYHCPPHLQDHVKSGGCWTARYAMRVYGKTSYWYIIQPDGQVVERKEVG